MDGTRLPWSIFGAIALCSVAQAVSAFPRLPERVASHFDSSGMPNGWMSKEGFFVVYAVMIGVSAFVGFYVPRQIETKSPARINLPHREYWLAPDRRAETLAYLERYFAWYACALLLILVLAMGLAIEANFTSPPRMPSKPILLVIGAFVVFNVLSVIHLLRHFSTPR